MKGAIMDNSSSMSNKLLVAASVVVIIAGLKLGASLIAPILFAFLITVLLQPIMSGMRKRGVPNWLAVMLVGFTAIVSIFLLIVVFTSYAQDLSSRIPHYTELLNQRLEPMAKEMSGIDPSYVLDRFKVDGTAVAQTGISLMSGFFSSMTSLLAFMFLLVLMIMASGGVINRYFDSARSEFRFAVHFTKWSHDIQVQYKIQTLSNFISAAITTGFFMIIGVDYAVLWGLLAFLLSYIPNIGLIIASLPPVILAFILHGWTTALIAIAFIFILNLIMDNIVTPKFIGRELKIPTVYVFISFLICTYIFGILGAFLSLPIFLAFRQTLLLNPNTRFIGLMMGSFASGKKDLTKKE